MRRATGALLSLALFLGGATAALSQTAVPPGFRVVSRSDLSAGVEYTKVVKAGPAVVAHVAHVLPGAPVELQVVSAHDQVSTGPTALETTSSMCGREQCVVGLNGDFNINGVPAGGVVAGGRMLRSPDPARPQLSITKDGHLVAGPLPWTGSLTFAGGGQTAVNTVNDDPPANGLALFTPDYGAATDASNRTELVVRAVRGAVGALNQSADLELRAIRTGAGPIPADGAVLSADGASAQQLRDAWARQSKPGGSAPARLALGSPLDVAESLGAYPVVLHGGQRAMPYGNDPNLIYPLQPHTLVGWNPAGDVYLVAVDGRQQASEGVTMAQAADFLLGLGATDAVSLDGGGGTTFVAGGSVLNRPSDPDPARPSGYTERGATNALVVMARPATPPPTAPPPPAPASVTPSVTTAPATADSGPPSDPSPSGSASPTAPDGSVLVGSLNGTLAESDPADLPLGPSGAGASAAQTAPGAPRLKSSGTLAGEGESSVGAPPAEPVRGGPGEGHKVTEALRAPLSVASSVTSDLVSAALGHGSSRVPRPGRTAGGTLVAALATSAVVTRRRRRRPERRRAVVVVERTARTEPLEAPTVEAAPVQPAAVVEPAVVEPAVVEPAVVEPAVVEPAVVEPVVVEPAAVELAVVELAVVELVVVEPVVEPAVVVEPVVEPAVVVEPVVVEPVVVEPVVVEPVVVEPVVVEPVAEVARAEEPPPPVFFREVRNARELRILVSPTGARRAPANRPLVPAGQLSPSGTRNSTTRRTGPSTVRA